MAAGAEADPLLGIGRIGAAVVVVGDQARRRRPAGRAEQVFRRARAAWSQARSFAPRHASGRCQVLPRRRAQGPVSSRRAGAGRRCQVLPGVEIPRAEVARYFPRRTRSGEMPYSARRCARPRLLRSGGAGRALRRGRAPIIVGAWREAGRDEVDLAQLGAPAREPQGARARAGGCRSPCTGCWRCCCSRRPVAARLAHPAARALAGGGDPDARPRRAAAAEAPGPDELRRDRAGAERSPPSLPRPRARPRRRSASAERGPRASAARPPEEAAPGALHPPDAPGTGAVDLSLSYDRVDRMTREGVIAPPDPTGVVESRPSRQPRPSPSGWRRGSATTPPGRTSPGARSTPRCTTCSATPARSSGRRWSPSSATAGRPTPWAGR